MSLVAKEYGYKGQEIAGYLWRDPSAITPYLKEGKKLASKVTKVHPQLGQNSNKQACPRISPLFKAFQSPKSSLSPLSFLLSVRKGGRDYSDFLNRRINMKREQRPIFYLSRSGFLNTDDVVAIVHNRLKEGDITSVVIASSPGKTGLKFARKMAE
jgi:hypothetical protein